MIYTALWAGIGFALVFLLFIRSPIDMTVAPVRNPVNVVLSDGSIRNTYDIRLRNMSGNDKPFYISIKGDDALLLQLEGADGQVAMVPANETFLQRVYITAPRDSGPATSDRTEFRFWVDDFVNSARAHTDTVYFGRTTE
jgi:polyferredoxin